MSTSLTPAVVITDLGFVWPDGTIALHDVTASFGRGRTGLTGRNGSGKSTLLRLIAGELTPATGTVVASATVGYLPQDLALAVDDTVAQALGIAERRAALAAVLSGEATPEDFDTVGDDWDIEERAAAVLADLGFEGGDLDRSIGTLSGGEAMLVGLARLRMVDTAITLLDEPTNNLDRRARELLYAAVRNWRGALIVVSHDRELLDLMDETAELFQGGMRTFGGNFSAYLEVLEVEREAAERGIRSAEQDLRVEKRQRVEAEVKLAHRARKAKTDYDNKRMPKIVMNERKSEAQVSAGKHRTMLTGKVDRATAALADAEARLRADKSIRVDLPGTVVPAGRTVLELGGEPHPITLRGPERVALVGPNGSGKTTLLEEIVRGGERVSFRIDAVGYLPQRLDVLDDTATVLENIESVAPESEPNEIRAQLARFLIRGDNVNRPVAQLSGGERFRVALARILLADRPPQLLLLDEPTNSLDLASVTQLVDAIAAYRGALIVVSHDYVFLERLGLDRWLEIDPVSGLTEGRSGHSGDTRNWPNATTL